MRGHLLFSCSLIVSCGGGTSTPVSDAGMSAGSDAASAETEAAAAACAPIRGETPFGVRLSGSATTGTDAGATIYASVDVYFPKGRVPGGEVVFVQRTYAGGSAITRATLDSTLSARGIRSFDPDCRTGVSGDLIGPAGGLAGFATNNSSAPSDALKTVSGHVVLCAAGDVPPQKVESPPTRTTALSPIDVRGTRPFSLSSFAGVTARTPSGPAALTVTELDPGAAVRPTTAYSWSEPTTIDLSALRDVLGTPLGFGTVVVEVPTAFATDLTFATALPAGSWIGDTPIVNGGKLAVGSTDAWRTAIAIGAVAGTTKLRLRHRLDCDPMESAAFAGAVLSNDGKSVSITPKCGTTSVDETISLAGAAPYVLYLAGPVGRSRPCNYPFRGADPAPYVADELEFQ